MMQKKPVDPHPIILNLLSSGSWYAPHEVNMQLRLQGCHCSAEATTARMRELRKAKFGGYILKKQKRIGTEYFEYRVIGRIQAEQSKAA
jgi:hypothetical protein